MNIDHSKVRIVDIKDEAMDDDDESPGLQKLTEKISFRKNTKEKRKRDFSSKTFVSREEIEYQERQRKRLEQIEANQREADALKEIKMKKSVGSVLASKRSQRDKGSKRNSRRSSVDLGFDGDKSPYLITPMNRSSRIDLRSETNSQRETARGSRNELHVDEPTPANKRNKKKDLSPSRIADTLRVDFNINFSKAHGSISEMNERAEADESKQDESKLTGQKSSPQNRLSARNVESHQHVDGEKTNENDYFNFTNSVKPGLDVEVISHINSPFRSKDQSQIDEVNDDILSHMEQNSKKFSKSEVSDSNTVILKPTELLIDTKRDNDESSRGGESVSPNYLQQIMKERGPDIESARDTQDNIQVQAEFKNQFIRNRQYVSDNTVQPKLSAYETAQNFLNQRPGTSSAASKLISPDLIPQRQTTSQQKQRVKIIRQQEAKSYKITNKVFFNRAKEVSKLKDNFKSLPKAPSMNKLYGKDLSQSTGQLKNSGVISRQFSQQGMNSNQKDSKLNPGETFRSFNDDEARPLTSSIVKHSSRKIIDGNPKITLNNRALVDLTPPHLNKQPTPVTIENLIPKPEEGVSEQMKFKILNERDQNYHKMSEVVQLIEDSRNLREEILSVLGPSSTSNIGTVKKAVPFSKITEFLMQKSKTDKLKQEDKDDLRDLIYSVNGYDRSLEPKLTYEWVDEKMTDVIKKGEKAYDVDKLYEYLDILRGIDDKKVNVKNTNMLKQVEKKEIERAEHNAVLAAHYQRLKKYYGEEFITKHFKEYHTLNQNEQQLGEAQKHQKVKNLRTPELLLTSTGKYDRKDLGTEYEQRIRNKLKMDYSLGELKPVEIRGSWAEEWPNINEIFNSRKQKVRTMERFEDMFEFFQRKMADEMNNEGQKVLTMEEKMIRYAQDFKENAKKREILKQKIDKNIREIRKNLDEFVDLNIAENDRRHDKEYCFREYVKALREGQL